VCLVGPPGTALGCDLELIEPRSDAFVGDFLTSAEQALVAVTGAERDLVANLVWCGKESALKVLRTGLRRDTRSVEVSFPDEAKVDGWAPMSVRSVEGTVFPGWWQRFGAFVLTLAATEPFAPPRPLLDPPGLATAVPAHSWLSERS
jgi:4'-phosphopantetheinyl transferase